MSVIHPDGSTKRSRLRPVQISARRMSWNFANSGVNDWLEKRPFLSAMMNVYTVLVPDNEKYYIRSMQPYVHQIKDELQRREVQEFFRQESLHGVAHRKHRERLSMANGHVQRIVNATNFMLYDVMEPIQPGWLRLSIVAAIEHINAALANSFLARDLLCRADPEPRRLFEWHFAEEIEHKAVAHDFLVTLFPGYFTRIIGGLVAYFVFYALLFGGTAYLLASEGALFSAKTAKDAFRYLLNEGGIRDSLGQFIRYLRPGFNPWSLNDKTLAEAAIVTHTARADVDDSAFSTHKAKRRAG